MEQPKIHDKSIEQIFDPTSFFTEEPQDQIIQRGLIILNRPFQADKAFHAIWSWAQYRVCADGGANWLCKAFEGRPVLTPSAIVGDFDSIKPDVMKYFQSRGSTMIQDRDQYSTDFAKSIRAFRKTMQSSSGSVIILCDVAGRLDQGIGILHEMLREVLDTEASELQIWLVSSDNVSWVLSPGRNVIRGLLTTYKSENGVDEKLFTANVGILPIYGPAVISTIGLEWDVKDWNTRMGGNVSTSNHVVKDEIVIETSNVVLFTIERKTSEG